MNESKNQNRFLPVIRWIARIWSILSLAFLLLFFGASIISSVGTSTFAFKDVYQFLFFPIGLAVGLILAWKWEGLGGIIATGSIIGFHLQMLIKNGNPDFNLFIELLAAPGILFILYWFLSRKRIVE